MVELRLVSLINLVVTLVVAQDLSASNKSSHCDADCKQLALDAAVWERSQHASDPPDAFYAMPADLKPDTPPGTLLRLEEHTNLTNYTIPSGLTMSRILYTSRDLNGTTVLASAFALWPYEVFDYTKGVGFSTSTEPEYPLVAWAHGTSGIYQRCAPSNYKALQYHFISTFELALEGFAIVAPDYAGLGASARAVDGSKHPHQWLAYPAHANDLAFAIQAIREAFPKRLAASGPFVAMGHSQGGSTAWSFAERLVKNPIPGYRGTIAFGPPLTTVSGLRDMLTQATNGVSVPPSAFGLLPLISAGITAAYPSLNFAGMSARVRDLLLNVLAPLETCFPSAMLAAASYETGDFLEDASWMNRSEVLEWERRVAVGSKAFVGPFLLINGGMDVATSETVTKTVDSTCAVKENSGQHLEYLELSAMGHFGVIPASRARWMQWVKDRTSQKPLITTCGSKTFVKGIDTNHTSFVGAFPPNWLVESVPVDEQWKLAL